MSAEFLLTPLIVVATRAPAAITGLAALLHTSAVAFTTLKYLGVAYLLYLAWSTLRERGALAVEEEGAPHSTRKLEGRSSVPPLSRRVETQGFGV
jgi:threonine/homoserine/homoserine lactone efflux protein